MREQKIVSLEAELERAHNELLKSKEQLAASETAKAEALREITETRLSHGDLSAGSDKDMTLAHTSANWGESTDWQAHLDAAIGQQPGNTAPTDHVATNLGIDSKEMDRLQGKLGLPKGHHDSSSEALCGICFVHCFLLVFCTFSGSASYWVDICSLSVST